jgi:hypothetical protein
VINGELHAIVSLVISKFRTGRRRDDDDDDDDDNNNNNNNNNGD